MRIYIVSRGYPTEVHVTNGLFEYDQAKALAALGHEVVFIALDLRSIRKKRKMGQVSFERDHVHIESINIPLSKFSKRLTRFVREKALKKMYRKCVNQYGAPDIIHAHFQEIAYTTAKVLKDEGIPMIMTEHLSKLINHEFSDALQMTGDHTYRYFDRVIAVSTALAGSLQEKFDVQAVIIPNIVDLTVFQYPGAKDKKTTDRFTVISVGHLKKVKRMDDLICSFSLFHAKHPDAYLRIIGIGPEYDNLKNLINEKQLQDCVTLVGKTPRNQIAEEMKTADCFALFSGSETFGVAFIEAIAMGLPVIATRCQGPEDFINDENGLLVDPGDIDAMARAFEDMYRNIDRYDGSQNSKNITEKFSPEKIARQIEGVYLSVIEKKV